MSTTLIHYGHIRLLKKAGELGSVMVALNTDDEVAIHKGKEFKAQKTGAWSSFEPTSNFS